MRLLTKAFWILICLILLNLRGFTQSLSCKLEGEGNESVVRLKWVPDSWPQNLQGFYVKRRSQGTGSWGPVHQGLIFPELDQEKSLDNVEPFAGESTRLKEKLADLIEANRASAIPREAYYDAVLNTFSKIQNLKLAFLVDYDFAILNGFGLIDRDIPSGGTFEYGLFPKYEGQQVPDDPISTFEWKYGDRPDASLNLEANKIKKNGNQVAVRWKVDTEDFVAKGLAGFNIYKKVDEGDFEKVNRSLRLISVTNNPEYVVYRDRLEEEAKVTYAAAPVTPFGTEGDRVEVAYTPKNVDIFIAPPVLRELPDDESGGGILLGWDFNAELEKYIDGFQIERSESNGADYTTLVNNLDAGVRSFTDNLLDGPGYYNYRLKVLQSSGNQIASNELLIFYNPSRIPVSPVGLVGNYVEEGANGRVELSWNGAKPNKYLDGYLIYSSKPGERYIAEDTRIGVVRQTNYQIDPGAYQRGEWRFSVVAVSTTGEQSGPSNEVRVLVPSRTLPAVVRKSSELADGSRVRVSWEYTDEIDDLKGFRILQGGETQVGEDQLGKQAREWVSPPLESGKKYVFQIQAVSSFGVVSVKTFTQISLQ